MEVCASGQDCLVRGASGSPTPLLQSVTLNAGCFQTSRHTVYVLRVAEASLADNMLRNIPQGAREIFEGGRFGGGNLVMLDSLVVRPGYKDPDQC